jgi:hypothetical protein
MTTFSLPTRLIGAVALTCAASAAHAAFSFGTISTPNANPQSTAQAFLATQIQPGAIDTFSDLDISNTAQGTSLSRSIFPSGSSTPFSYTWSTQTQLYSVPTPVYGTGPALSVELPADTMTLDIANTAPQVFSFGASVYLSNFDGAAAVGGTGATLLKVVATDVLNASQTFTFAQAVSAGVPNLYLTLGSSVALKSIQFIAPLSVGGAALNQSLYMTVDNVVTAVPEPSSVLMMMAGLGGLAMVARRRS